MGKTHIADIDYTRFFRNVFSDYGEAKAFIESIEKTDTDKCLAKLVIHQTARMLWLADRIDVIARGRPALQILFYIIAAEAVAKIYKNFKGEGRSKEHVLIFFEQLSSDEHRSLLSKAFVAKPSRKCLSTKEAATLLYDVRCDVAHRGQYFEFHLSGETPITTQYKGGFVTASISIGEIRQIILETAVLIAKRQYEQRKR